METPDFVLAFFGALGASCLVFGALSVMFVRVTTIARQPFPAPYRAMPRPVQRHRRRAEWPGQLLEGWREFAVAHAVLKGELAWI